MCLSPIQRAGRERTREGERVDTRRGKAVKQPTGQLRRHRHTRRRREGVKSSASKEADDTLDSTFACVSVRDISERERQKEREREREREDDSKISASLCLMSSHCAQDRHNERTYTHCTLTYTHCIHTYTDCTALHRAAGVDSQRKPFFPITLSPFPLFNRLTLRSMYVYV